MSDSDDNNDIAEVLAEELFDFCQSDSLSEEGLRDIIERHGLTPTNNCVEDYRFFLTACSNKRVNEEIIRLLLEYFPDAAGVTDEDGMTPLHFACGNKNMTLNITQLLIDAAPASVRSVTNRGWVPIYYLCFGSMNEATAIQILKPLIEKCPEAVRHADDEGDLPIHYAAGHRSPEFCRVLIEAYTGSERRASAEGELLLHHACAQNTVATVEFLHKLYPDAINHATDGLYPIHFATTRTSKTNHLTGAVEIVQYLLDCDPNVKLQKVEGLSLLHFACLLTGEQYYNDPNTINAALEIIKALYDAHPEAIEDERIVRGTWRYHEQVQAFINSETTYARQANDRSLMTTPDDNGQLSLHAALQNNVRLGSIKLLVKGNPNAVQFSDNSGALPLHIACQHNSASVVKYLVNLDTSTLDDVDRGGNTALHLACRSARHEIIAMLLEKYDAVSVSKQNAHKNLPIDLLRESDLVSDRKSIKYTESVYRLMRSYPEMIMSMGTKVQVQSTLAACPSDNYKKRKWGDV